MICELKTAKKEIKMPKLIFNGIFEVFRNEESFDVPV